jgi:predicted enzyme related to lactoylglutathione lyase
LHKAGIPYTSFVVEDMAKEQERLLAAGVVFQSEPMKVGDVVMAVIDDTCGNLLQLVQP